MRHIRPALFALLTLVLITGCAAHKSEVVPKPVPNPDCWVRIYDADHFASSGSSAIIHGPIEFPTLDNVEGKDWEDDIESFIVGPRAELQVWKSLNYAGTALTFQPNQKMEALGDINFQDEIGSMKVVCK